MARTVKLIQIFSLLFFVAPIILGIFHPSESFSEEETSKPQLSAGFSISENLNIFKGKTVTINLSSGQSISGTVKDVRNGILHLEKIVQKEYYDAIIIIDRINSIEARVRDKL